MFACQQNGHLAPGKIEICCTCIIENLASIKTRILRKTIEGLHDIFRFFCFTLGKNLSLVKPRHLPTCINEQSKPGGKSYKFSYKMI